MNAAERPPEQDTHALTPILESNIDRPLRYSPNGTDFVITNGVEFFNRPLYSANAPFRIDGGDRPQFSLYLAGRGGNLRFGWIENNSARWLDDIDDVVARYRPGSLVYDIAGGALRLTILPLRDTRGLIGRLEARGATTDATLVLAFGGVNGMRGRRSGDIGCENLPVSEFFQLRPDQCREDRITLGQGLFLTRGRPGLLGCVLPGSDAAIADATHWSSLAELKDSATTENERLETPLALLTKAIRSASPIHFILQQMDTNAVAADLDQFRDPATLARLFAEAESQRRAIAERVRVETPDPFVNAAAAALNVAADAVWDARQQSFMHGAVAWRNRLLGWRGLYSGDALGWHDRTRLHIEGFSRQQNTNPIPDQIPPADANANLSRSEAALHSNGNMTRNHYDMNLVAIDGFFRHLMWTGDLDFAERLWPVLERHMAWERRMFRREFGPDRLPLYEAYAAIWASDDLAYNGGGSTHGSAYNLFHNRMAAKVAGLLGRDAAPYAREAELIEQAMQRELWMPELGSFAEWKDLLGLGLVHPNAAAWTFYHAVDSRATSPEQAWQMSRFIDTTNAKIPIRGHGVPEGYFTQPTTTWMPYTWSLNNVVLSEVQHTALAHWQAGRSDAAFRLFKGAILDSMFLGLCPGNVGMATFYDAYRRESQRDFADGVGSLSRAFVKGLFGIQPDALAGEITIRPGFPEDWSFARLHHPDLSVIYERSEAGARYVVETRFNKPMRVKLQVIAPRDDATVTINGQSSDWRPLERSIGSPRIEIVSQPGARHEITISWSGRPVRRANYPQIAAAHSNFRAANMDRILSISDPQQVFANTTFGEGAVSGKVVAASGHRTVFAQVQQGQLRWTEPFEFEVRPAFEIVPSQVQQPGELRFRIRNNTPEALVSSNPLTIRVAGTERREAISLAPLATSDELVIAAPELVPGANLLTVSIPERGTVSNQVVNWRTPANSDLRFEPVRLSNLFNDRVTQIFKNDYLSPRSPFCSLAVPKQGIGSWCHPTAQFEVDDSGLRSAARENNGLLRTPQGIPLATPTAPDARNILFTSRWDNYPDEAEVPLNGRASHAYLLMAGSSNPMQSRFDNGEVIVTYADGSTTRLPLRNPDNWWLIEQDYFIDDFAFRRNEPIPPRVHLRTGEVRVTDPMEFKGKGRTVRGGAATLLDLPLDASKELKSLTVRSLANEVVIGLMGITLLR